MHHLETKRIEVLRENEYDDEEDSIDTNSGSDEMTDESQFNMKTENNLHGQPMNNHLESIEEVQ